MFGILIWMNRAAVYGEYQPMRLTLLKHTDYGSKRSICFFRNVWIKNNGENFIRVRLAAPTYIWFIRNVALLA